MLQEAAAAEDIVNHFGADFGKRFFATMIGDQLTPEEDRQLVEASIHMLNFAAIRQPEQAAIHVLPGRIFIINDDMPFLIDSIAMCLRSMGLAIDRIVHPIIPVTRDAMGRIVDIGETGSNFRPESMVLVLLQAGPQSTVVSGIPERLAEVLEDVRFSVTDWPVMMSALDSARQTIPTAEAAADLLETAAFLDWLKQEHFTFLGTRVYKLTRRDEGTEISIEKGSGLGILRDDAIQLFNHLRGFTRDADAKTFMSLPERLVVTKSKHLSTVHRHAPMDAIGLKELDTDGQPVRLHLIVGLFTTRAYGRAARDIPLIRRKVATAIQRAGFTHSSHNGKLITQLLDTYPRDELFQITEEELYHAAMQLMSLEKRPRFGLFVRRDQFDQFVSLMIYTSRQRYDYALRQRLEKAALEWIPGASHILISESSISGGENLARLHLVLLIDAKLPASMDEVALTNHLALQASGWEEKLVLALSASDQDQTHRLAQRYASAFPMAYRNRTEPADALVDIQAFEDLTKRSLDAPILRISGQIAASEAQLGNVATLALYRTGSPIPLSDLLPILERFGFRVLTEAAYAVNPSGLPEMALQSLTVEVPKNIALVDHSAKLTEAFDAIWQGDAESDALNRLTMVQGLDGRQVAILRGFTKYLRQARFRFTQEAIEASFNAHPHFAGLFVQLFEILHDPKIRSDAEARGEAVEEQILAALETITNADDDAIFRAFLLLIRSTLRTNYFQKEADGSFKPAIAFKLDSKAITSLLPLPVPLIEIFVYSARFEAVHLRGGKIARGGIRWSDRREDFRTEILGLMKAQMVKNTVIVPVGSKGGFVLKRPPAAGNSAALRAEGIACYRMMMRSLLDITDNLAFDGTVIPPQNVVRLDGDDPYLVVAADKGTATFSDIANGVSQEYGFWLDDAFASGGSSGYDHKHMGITARGAWESVKRHFRELGRNVQTEPVTVAGVGDMSGDVFGNGLLQSRTLKLVAAFDHRHIFLDPSPDPAASYLERKRLFDLPGSSWDDYNRSLLSKGGEIVPRSAKSINLSPELRTVLAVEAERMTPSDLIRAILRAPVDLLFFGGIGTYIKGISETNADVGDRANDANRIDGDEVRAAIIGEGANLGVTQQGRIAFAARGGRVNTDFIDNSAGVDTSDHEVNIKILLKPLVDSGKLTRPARDTLLTSMTDEVASLVLKDNYQQSQTLSRLEARTAMSFDADIRFMRALERRGTLDRTVENLPDDEELAERAAAGRGLTRPELAVLFAYGKITIYDRLIHSDFMSADFESELHDYFPTALRKDYSKQIKSHALKREIVMTSIVNAMVNRVGPTFVHDIELRTGADLSAIVCAFLRVREAFGLDAIWAEIESLDGVRPAHDQTRLFLMTEALINRVVPRLLRPGVASTVDAKVDHAAVTALAAALWASGENTLENPLAEAPLAQRLALFGRLTPALDLVPLAKSSNVKLETLARLYIEISHRFELSWLSYTASILQYVTDWERRAADALIDEAYDLAQELVSRIVATGTSKGAVARFAAKYAKETARLETVLTEARAAPAATLSLLMLVASEIRRLVQAARE